MKLTWTRGGDGSHWEGCYNTHWDCAIRELREALDDLVSAIDNGWGTNAPYPAWRLDSAIEIYDATEEKYDDRP